MRLFLVKILYFCSIKALILGCGKLEAESSTKNLSNTLRSHQSPTPPELYSGHQVSKSVNPIVPFFNSSVEWNKLRSIESTAVGRVVVSLTKEIGAIVAYRAYCGLYYDILSDDMERLESPSKLLYGVECGNNQNASLRYDLSYMKLNQHGTGQVLFFLGKDYYYTFFKGLKVVPPAHPYSVPKWTSLPNREAFSINSKGDRSTLSRNGLRPTTWLSGGIHLNSTTFFSNRDMEPKTVTVVSTDSSDWGVALTRV